ncbi:MAG: nucleotide exchange factor GrpE [Woeseia sp.]|nr:nucleotide exchange factor GrpE [Woeseia sp.]|tara:strand:- start:3497 stop:4084 length:588 start_codon:yes stop_codon:yes gene_type:complete
MSEKENQADDVDLSNATNIANSSDDQSNSAQSNKVSTEDGVENKKPPSDLEKAEAKAKENWDLYLRALAELENVRKRTKKDVENAHKFALERFSRELLAVRDSIEMGLTADESTNIEKFIEGNKASLKILSTTMQQFGIEEINPSGEPFDPEYHEAISMQSSDKVEPGSVINVIQKGYSLNGRLLRPAMVIVSEN